MPGFPRRLLHDHEDIVLDLHPHWSYFAPQLAALFVALVLGLLLLILGRPQGLWVVVGLLVLGCLAWFGLRYTVWTNTHYVITTDRLISRHGVVSRKGTEISLQRVSTVRFRQTLLERLLGYGELVIEAGGDEGQQRFANISDPTAVQNEIYRQKEAKESRRFDRVGAATSGRSSVDTIPGQIRELDELRKRGVLSDDEFSRKKQQLLDRM